MSESVFLSPKSIAVIGASDKQGSVGRAITSNIMNGYKGTVYPISPTRETVFDQKAYKSVMDVSDTIDLAVIITKNTIVPVVLEECGKKKIKGVIVITAGFKEVDEEGKKLEQKLKDIATKYGVKVIGPNCLGVMNLEPKTMMNSTFLKITPKFPTLVFHRLINTCLLQLLHKKLSTLNSNKHDPQGIRQLCF